MSFLDGGSTTQAPGPSTTARPPLKIVPQDEQDTVSKPDPSQVTKLKRWMKSANIAEEFDDVDGGMFLNSLGAKVCREFQIDEQSRSDWKTKTEAAMQLAMQQTKQKQYPWPNAANVIYPLMTSAAVQFAARAYPAIISDRNVVRGIVVGRDDGTPEIGPLGPKIDPQTQQPVWHIAPGEKKERAKRIGDHMSWQLLQEQTEWEPETDQLLHILPIVGCAFRKTFFDSRLGRNSSLLVSAMHLVVNYYAKSLESAPRITEELRLYPQEVKEQELSGVFLEIPYGTENPKKGDDQSSAGLDEDAPRHYYEQHRWEDLDDDGYKEPYIVTVHADSQKVVRITARYDEYTVRFLRNGKIGKIDALNYYTQYNFLPNPEGGIYGVGFGQLLRPLNEAVNTTINQLIDAGHLSITGGGFVGRQLSMSTGTLRFSPGEFKVVNATGENVRAAVVQLQFPGPSDVLFKLLGLLIEAGKEISSVKDVLMGDQQNANVPATTTLALIEQGLKVFSGIYKRIYRSLKCELDKLYRLNRVYMDFSAEYQIGDEWNTITQGDYELGAGVAPVSDPTMVTDMQKAARANLLLGFKDDQRLNGVEIFRRAFEAVNVDNIDALFNKGPMMPSPEIMMAGMELEMKGKRYQAQDVLDIARAVHAMARATMETDENTVSNLEQRMKLLEAQKDQQQQSPTQALQGGGQPGQQQAGQPPMPGSKMAPDGKWYAPDPSRPGKYLRINTGAGQQQSPAPAPAAVAAAAGAGGP